MWKLCLKTRWIRSCLAGRTYSAQVADVLSQDTKIKSGVSRGWVIGPPYQVQQNTTISPPDGLLPSNYTLPLEFLAIPYRSKTVFKTWAFSRIVSFHPLSIQRGCFHVVYDIAVVGWTICVLIYPPLKHTYFSTPNVWSQSSGWRRVSRMSTDNHTKNDYGGWV